MSTQPRRSTRQTARAGPSSSARHTKRSKRVVLPADPEEFLKSLTESPKSILTRVDFTVLLNVHTWGMLSDEARNELSKLLPPTAFLGFKDSRLSSPSNDSMDIDKGLSTSSAVDPFAVFSNPYLLSAAETWQDHLYSGWLSPIHREKVENFVSKTLAGDLAAPWKDDVWLSERSDAQLEESSGINSMGTLTPCLAGGATLVKFTTLVEKGVLQLGDILAYRRTFSTLGITVEKDAIISAIHPKTHALTVVTTLGVAKDLPADLLHGPPRSPGGPFSENSKLFANISGPSPLEARLLDEDGRLDKAQRPNGNAWKSFSVWRIREGAETSLPDNRGGRENHGTLFYLRSIYFNEQ